MFDDDDSEYTEAQREAHERRITRCRTRDCRARIVFLPTDTGDRMPVEADSVKPDDEEFDPKRHESHFARCTRADKYRRRR